MGEAGLRQRFGRGATVVMVLASNLPDVDIVTGFFLGQEAFLFRRMLTHSVFGIGVFAAMFAFLFKWFYPHISWRVHFGLTALGMGVHVFFDLVNSYGVVLFYPLSRQRFELAWIFIIDLVLWGLLIFPVLLRPIKAPWANSRKLFQLSMAGVAVYVAVCGLAHARAASLLRHVYAKEEVMPEFHYVFPEVFGPHRFRGVVKGGEKYRTYLIHLISETSEFLEEYWTDENKPEVRAVRATEAVSRLEWFYKAPVWQILDKTPAWFQPYPTKNVLQIKASNGSKYAVFDLRFKSALLNADRTPFAFWFQGTSLTCVEEKPIGNVPGKMRKG